MSKHKAKVKWVRQARYRPGEFKFELVPYSDDPAARKAAEEATVVEHILRLEKAMVKRILQRRKPESS